MNLPQPYNIKFHDWANLFKKNYPNLKIPTSNESTSWKEWGELIKLNPIFFNIPTPDFLKFVSWNEWAENLILHLQRTTLD